MTTQHLYAVHFATGLTKVGRSSRPTRRVAEHIGRASRDEARVVASHSALVVGNVITAEAALIARCKVAATERRGHEWFVGLDMDEVRGWVDEAAATVDSRCEQPPYRVRQSGPWIDPSGSYICRACCRFFAVATARSGFLCAACIDAGYRFEAAKGKAALTLAGDPVPLWHDTIGATDVIDYPGVMCEDLRPDVAWVRIDMGPGGPALGKALHDYQPPAPIPTDPAPAVAADEARG